MEGQIVFIPPTLRGVCVGGTDQDIDASLIRKYDPGGGDDTPGYM
jgi:hypothetical protein